MILDTGILTILRQTDVTESGGMPRMALSRLTRCWYVETRFGSRRADPTGTRPDRQVDARVRIHRFRDIREGDVVILSDVAATGSLAPAYTVDEFWHDTDPDSGEQVTDLYLRRYEKAVTLA